MSCLRTTLLALPGMLVCRRHWWLLLCAKGGSHQREWLCCFVWWSGKLDAWNCLWGWVYCSERAMFMLTSKSNTLIWMFNGF